MFFLFRNRKKIVAQLEKSLFLVQIYQAQIPFILPDDILQNDRSVVTNHAVHSGRKGFTSFRNFNLRCLFLTTQAICLVFLLVSTGDHRVSDGLIKIFARENLFFSKFAPLLASGKPN